MDCLNHTPTFSIKKDCCLNPLNPIQTMGEIEILIGTQDKLEPGLPDYFPPSLIRYAQYVQIGKLINIQFDIDWNRQDQTITAFQPAVFVLKGMPVPRSDRSHVLLEFHGALATSNQIHTVVGEIQYDQTIQDVVLRIEAIENINSSVDGSYLQLDSITPISGLDERIVVNGTYQVYE